MQTKLWLVKKTRSLSQWQLNGSCLPLLCSLCPHLEINSVGNKREFTYVVEPSRSKCVANQMLSNVEVANAELSRNFWIAIGACSEWQKIAWKVQSKNNCKGNYWCVNILWGCPALNWKRLINWEIMRHESLSNYIIFILSNVCMMADGFLFISVAAASVSWGKAGSSKLREWLLHQIFHKISAYRLELIRNSKEWQCLLGRNHPSPPA